MITLNITIGGNLCLELHKGYYSVLRALMDEIPENQIVSAMLDMTSYENYSVEYGLIVRTNGDLVEKWIVFNSFSAELVENKRVVFKKV